MSRTTGERVIFWTLPAVAVIWIAAFFLFPGFVPPMSPTASAAEVAAFYSHHTSRVRYSMILFNWFCVALIPILMLIVERMRGMAHRTPVLRYCVIGVAGAAPIAFLTVHRLLAHRRVPTGPRARAHPAAATTSRGSPSPAASRSSSRCASSWRWRSTSIGQDEPVFPRWVARFNVVIAIALVPAGFAGLTLERPVRLERVPVVLGQERRHRALDRRDGRRARTVAATATAIPSRSRPRA